MGESFIVHGLKSLVNPGNSRKNVGPFSDDWSFEKLSALPTDQLIDLLEKVPDFLESRSVCVKTILPAMVKMVATHNWRLKQAVCHVLVLATEMEPDLASDVGLLAVNVLSKDLEDPNPEVRSTAITAICSLKVLGDFSNRAILNGLEDPNPRVRKAAAVGCGKLWRHSPEAVETYGLIDVLYSAVRDPDNQVMAFALQTLNVVLESEGGVVINLHMTNYLLQRLDDCKAMEKVFLMDYLGRFSRLSDGDANNETTRLRILNTVDPYLEDKNPSVILAASRLFFGVAVDIVAASSAAPGDQPHRLMEDFLVKVKPHLMRLVRKGGSGGSSFHCDVFRFLLAVGQKSSSGSASGPGLLAPFVEDHKCFRIMKGDPVELQRLKCVLQTQLFLVATTSGHHPTVSEEISLYLASELSQADSSRVKDDLVQALFQVSSGSSARDRRQICETLADLLLKSETTTGEASTALCVLGHIRELNFGDSSDDGHEDDEAAISRLLRILVRKALDDHKSTLFSGPYPALGLNLLWAIDRHSAKLPDHAPYFLEEICQHICQNTESEDTTIFCCKSLYPRLLATGVAVFSRQPASSQHILGRIMELCVLQGDPDLVHRVAFYSALLRDKSFYQSDSNQLVP